MNKSLAFILVGLLSIASFANQNKKVDSKKAAAKTEVVETASQDSNSYSSGKKFNITFAPVPVLLGMINGQLDYKLNEDWSVGGNAMLWNITIGSFKWNATGLGGQATWYKNGIYKTGLYAGPAAGYLSMSTSYTSGTTSGSGSVSTFFVGGNVGYAWYWSSFNLNVGGAASLPIGNTSVTFTDSNGTRQTQTIPLGFGLDFRLGWTF